jgi:D-lactate dehydrogenase
MDIKIIFFGSKPYVKDMFAKANDKYKYTMKFHNFNINVDNAILAEGYDVVCVFVNDYVNDEVLQILKQGGCKLLALRCAGYNNVDLEAAKRLGIPVVRVPEYSPYAVAEYAMSLIMTLNRKIHKAYNRVRESNFSIDGLLGFDLNGKTIGVIGTGKIGAIFARIAKGFGMNIIAYDLYPNNEKAKDIGFEYVDINDIYKRSDIIALHCPLTKDNYHIINKQSLELMKKGVMIINTSRGGLVDANALIDALKTGNIGAVGLDVYEEEDKIFFEDFSGQSGITDDVLARLLSFNNVLVTSHQAFFTREALNNISDTTLNNIKTYFEQSKLLNSVY